MLIKQISVFKQPSICIKMACAILPTLALKIYILIVVHLAHLNDVNARNQALFSLEPPVGILCESDRYARLAMHQLKQMGWQCGQDYLIVGNGNDPTQSAHLQ